MKSYHDGAIVTLDELKIFLKEIGRFYFKEDIDYYRVKNYQYFITSEGVAKLEYYYSSEAKVKFKNLKESWLKKDEVE